MDRVKGEETMLRVLVLRDEACPYCDEVMKELRELKTRFPSLHVRERLLDAEPELASRLGVTASPAIVVNNQLAFQGQPDRAMLCTYLKNVEAGLHNDPNAYPPDDERDPENQGQEATGSSDPAWRGSGRTPSFGSHPGGRH
jgi:protein-disulfide isomerase